MSTLDVGQTTDDFRPRISTAEDNPYSMWMTMDCGQVIQSDGRLELNCSATWESNARDMCMRSNTHVARCSLSRFVHFCFHMSFSQIVFLDFIMNIFQFLVVVWRRCKYNTHILYQVGEVVLLRSSNRKLSHLCVACAGRLGCSSNQARWIDSMCGAFSRDSAVAVWVLGPL